ncbi:hypothetical protein AGMMS49992_07820 [Clostridia bacterium]|nr:hypothetical protein AGMMS49992_07820 [Clostridia bacterium]
MTNTAVPSASTFLNAPEEHISGTQWAFTACCFLMGTILRSGMINSIMDNESWLISFTGAVAFIPLMLIYLALTRRFPGMNLFQIADAALGKVGGFIVSAMLCVFYIMLATVNLMEIGSFVTGYLISGTPFLAVMIAAALAAAYVLTKGMGALSRLIPLITILTGAMLLINWAQSLSAADFSNLLPMFNKPAPSYIHATAVALAIPYGESLTMFALMPMVGPQQDMKRPMLGTMAITCAVMLLVHIREIVTLGPMLTYTSLPTYEVMRMIDSSSTFTRTESVFAIQLMTLSFIKATIIIYALSRGLAHITRLELIKPNNATNSSGSAHKAIVLPVCLFIAVYATTFHETPYNNIAWYVNVAPIIWLVFEAALPIVMLAAGALRGRRREAAV